MLSSCSLRLSSVFASSSKISSIGSSMLSSISVVCVLADPCESTGLGSTNCGYGEGGGAREEVSEWSAELLETILAGGIHVVGISRGNLPLGSVGGEARGKGSRGAG